MTSSDSPEEQNITDVTIKLIPKKDRHGATYHIARCDAPVLVDLRECTFFIFTSKDPMISIRRTKP